MLLPSKYDLRRKTVDVILISTIESTPRQHTRITPGPIVPVRLGTDGSIVFPNENIAEYSRDMQSYDNELLACTALNYESIDEASGGASMQIE